MTCLKGRASPANSPSNLHLVLRKCEHVIGRARTENRNETEAQTSKSWAGGECLCVFAYVSLYGRSKWLLQIFYFLLFNLTIFV